MIVRILGEGQWDVEEEHLDALNALDDAVEHAVDADDEAAFTQSLGALLDAVRRHGDRLEDDALEDSDLILPPADASISEVRALLAGDGLIPG
jgi:PspAA-like protein